jgi:hypothetical protein
MAEDGTEKPSASFSGSGCASVTAGGDNGSLSSGIDSCTGALPLMALEVLSSIGDSGIVPFGVSLLGGRVRLGLSGIVESREDCCWCLKGDVGRSAVELNEGPKLSRSLDLPLPNPLKAEPKFEEDFRSGDDARPYGCALCLRRPSTVPNRLRGFELCFSGATNKSDVVV